MNDYELVISEVKKQIDNTQSKINLYYDQRPPSQCFYPPTQRPTVIAQPSLLHKPTTFLHQSNYIAPQSHYSTQMPASPIVNIPVTQPFLSRTSSSPNKSQSKITFPTLPPINPTNEQINNMRLKSAQATVLKNQLQINRLHKQKQNYEQFLQNSMVIQNNIVNYPYGNHHASLMEKIITQKTIDDYQNQRILLKFQKEAEEFKKSKSKHIKHLHNIVLSSKDLAESQFVTQREKSDIDLNAKSMFFSSKKIQQESPHFNSPKTNSYQVSRGKTIETQLNVSQYAPSIPEPLIQSPYRRTQVSQYQASSPPSIKLKQHQKLKKLLPITDDGQDGLKLIRLNLMHRRKHKRKPSEIPPKQRTINSSDQQRHQQSVQQIKGTIRQISDIMKSNRSFISNITRRVKTNPININGQVEQSCSPSSTFKYKYKPKQDQKQSSRNFHIDTPKIRLNLSKLKNKQQNPQNIIQCKKKLMQLSQVFE